MDVIDQYSKVTAEFALQWRSDGGSHIDMLWASPVSFWRDVVNDELKEQLIGKVIGESAQVHIDADRFYAPFSRKKIVHLHPSQFRGSVSAGPPPAPSPGRFYPQGLLRGVGGVFRQTLAPCRFLGRDGNSFVFDLNHPLAGRDLTLSMKVLEYEQVEKERGGRCEDWLERIAGDGPGMQARFSEKNAGFFSAENFTRADEGEDKYFYQAPRLVHHLDSTARATISKYYSRLIPDGANVLDLMGSWDSHLSQSLNLGGLTVLGMNREELDRNPRASERLVHDLNTRPKLPFSDNSFDAVVCTASIEYLTDPLRVMAELRRIVRSGGVLAFSFTNRWFPPKAIALWMQLHEFERLGWVAELFYAAGGFKGITTLSHRGRPRPTDDIYQELMYSDPVYMVWAHKK